MLIVLIFTLGLASGAASGEKTDENAAAVPAEETATLTENTVSSPRPTQKATVKPEPTVPPNPWLGYENVCETFTVYQSNKRTKKGTYPVRYKRNRYKRRRKDQLQTKKLIEMVAEEMGANPDLVEMLAAHESSHNPEAIHILNPDLEANQRAWQKFSYHRSNELALEAQMAKTSKQAREYYSLKRRLSRTRLYKGNPFWKTKLKYEFVHPAFLSGEAEIPEERETQWASVWGYGYGLYGMNAILYTHVWDKTAPPWVLCGDEGIVATVTAIWALREQQKDCDFLTAENPQKYGTDGGSYRGVIRRYARGQCSDKRLGKAWRKLMDNRKDKVDWDAHAELGTKWPRYEMKRRNKKLKYVKDENGKKIRTDRNAVIEHMRAKALSKGLLRETPLERKDANTAPTLAMN